MKRIEVFVPTTKRSAVVNAIIKAGAGGVTLVESRGKGSAERPRVGGARGMDVMDALVKDGIMNKQKVVIFTATSPTKEEIDVFLEKGAHSVLKKPFEPDILSKFVHKLESER